MSSSLAPLSKVRVFAFGGEGRQTLCLTKFIESFHHKQSIMGEPKLQEAKVIILSLIPTLEEVINHLVEKYKYPRSFAEHYGSKFWYFYDSKNWMVGKNKMTRWKSAFAGQWSTIKDPKDELLLTNALRKQVNQTPKIDPQTPQEKRDRTLEYLNETLTNYFKHPTWDQNYEFIYDYLKENKPFKLTPEEVRICKEMGPQKGKAQAVKFLFDKMINNGSKFS